MDFVSVFEWIKFLVPIIVGVAGVGWGALKVKAWVYPKTEDDGFEIGALVATPFGAVRLIAREGQKVKVEPIEGGDAFYMNKKYLVRDLTATELAFYPTEEEPAPALKDESKEATTAEEEKGTEKKEANSAPSEGAQESEAFDRIKAEAERIAAKADSVTRHGGTVGAGLEPFVADALSKQARKTPTGKEQARAEKKAKRRRARLAKKSRREQNRK